MESKVFESKILDSVQKNIEKSEHKIIFVVGNHGVGKTYAIENYFKEHFPVNLSARVKYRLSTKKFSMKKINIGSFSSHEEVLNRIIPFSNKLLLFLLVIIVLCLAFNSISFIVSYATSRFPRFFKSDYGISSSELFPYILAISAFIFLYQRYDYYFNVQSILGKLGRKSNKWIWLDDIERSRLSYSEQWGLIEQISSYPSNFLITIGYSGLEEYEKYMTRIEKFRDTLSNKKDLVRVYEYFGDLEASVLLMEHYYKTNLKDCNPFSEDRSKLEWLSLFTCRDINKILVLIDSQVLHQSFTSEELQTVKEHLKVEQEINHKLFLKKDNENLQKIIIAILSIKVFIRFICLKLGINYEELFSGLRINGAGLLGWESLSLYYESNEDLSSERFHKLGLVKILKDMLLSLKELSFAKEFPAEYKNLIAPKMTVYVYQHDGLLKGKSELVYDFTPILLEDSSNDLLKKFVLISMLKGS